MNKNELKKDPNKINNQKAKAEVGDMILFIDQEVQRQMLQSFSTVEKGIVEERKKHPNGTWMYMVKPLNEKGLIRWLVFQDEIIEVLKQ